MKLRNYCYTVKTCLNWTFNKPEFSINCTLNTVSMWEIFVNCTCINWTPVYNEHLVPWGFSLGRFHCTKKQKTTRNKLNFLLGNYSINVRIPTYTGIFILDEIDNIEYFFLKEEILWSFLYINYPKKQILGGTNIHSQLRSYQRSSKKKITHTSNSCHL